MSAPTLYVALDVASAAEARALARALRGLPVGLKIGLELVYGAGPALVRELSAQAPVMLDAKLHDIPQTVERAARAIGRLGASLVTVHALSGREVLERAVAAAAGASRAAGFPPARVLAVTLLTSHDEAVVRDELGLGEGLSAAVVRLSRTAAAAGCAGVVCAPSEAQVVRAALGPAALVVTPGIRPVAAAVRADDQRRVATAAAAIAAGASMLVVGRPITAAPDPRRAAAAILAEAAAPAARAAQP
jgi:orotidine-5'-phosphate decarboxylase